MTKPLIYLASPYSDPDPQVMARRAACVAAVTARLLKEGKHVFSPIAYSHQFAVEHGMGTDWETWKEFGLVMMDVCGGIAVLRIPGWKQSRGIKAELWHRGLPDIMPLGTTYIDPTPEELAILDEPEEENSKPCKWRDPENDMGCLDPSWNETPGFLECDDDPDTDHECDHYEPKEQHEPITQPEPKCFFWSDDGKGGNRHCRCDCSRFAIGVRKESHDTPCSVIAGSVGSTTECDYFQPADESKTATLSLGEDGMKLEVDEAICRWFNPANIGGTICTHKNWEKDWSICSEGKKGLHQFLCHEPQPEPTAEEKIIEGLEGFADELEAGKVVVHPCKWNSGIITKGAWVCECLKKVGLPTETHYCGWNTKDTRHKASWCRHFAPREIPPPEYDPDDVAFTDATKVESLTMKARGLLNDYHDTMSKLIEIAAKERKSK